MSAQECRDALSRAVARLDPIVSPHGFRYVDDAHGEGHESFASGWFVGDAVKIGLIFRKRGTLGAVIYENDESNMSHDDLLRYLGAQDRQRLIYKDSGMKSISRGGGDPIDALIFDLREIVGQTLTNRERLAEFISTSLNERFPNLKRSPEGITLSTGTHVEPTPAGNFLTRLLKRFGLRR